MTGKTPATDPADERRQHDISDEAVRRLAEVIGGLGNDPNYFVHALADYVQTLKPIRRDRQADDEVNFIINSGDFTADEWAETAAAVDRGSLQLSATEGWLLDLVSTKSVAEVSGFLGWSDEVVRNAVAGGSLFAVEVSGRLRFPSWQFQTGSPAKLLPGLADVIRALTARWHPQSAAGFMATPQRSLVGEGPKTPAEWLRDGGDVTQVIRIVENSGWS
jgi:hypothetical protein